MQILSVILDFLSWPVSWTGCHHQEPESHLALLRMLGQVYALNCFSFGHFWTFWMKHPSVGHEIWHPMAASKGMAQSASLGEVAFQRKSEMGLIWTKKCSLFLPPMGSFKVGLLNTDSPEAFTYWVTSLLSCLLWLFTPHHEAAAHTIMHHFLSLHILLCSPSIFLTSATLCLHLAIKESAFNPYLKFYVFYKIQN